MPTIVRLLADQAADGVEMIEQSTHPTAAVGEQRLQQPAVVVAVGDATVGREYLVKSIGRANRCGLRGGDVDAKLAPGLLLRLADDTA